MRAVNLRDNDGGFCAILGNPGRIYTPYVRMESNTAGPFIRKRSMPNGDIALHSTPLMKGIDPYPIKRACNHMLRVGRTLGITKGARKLLQAAKREG
jgi:hypothetical protein